MKKNMACNKSPQKNVKKSLNNAPRVYSARIIKVLVRQNPITSRNKKKIKIYPEIYIYKLNIRNNRRAISLIKRNFSNA
jgi:hypothetical protein